MSTINAGTTVPTALTLTGDTSGTLSLATGGTTRMTVTSDGNLNFAQTGQRITGDMSNATLANRLMFQTSTTNGATQLRVIPNGTGTTGSIQAGNNNDPANQSVAALNVDSSEVRLASQINGTGTYLPMTFYTNGSEKLRIAADATGTYTFGGTAPRITGDMSNATLSNRLAFQSSTTNGNTTVNAIPNGTATQSQFVVHAGTDMDNTSRAGVNTSGTQAIFFADKTGTGTYLPMTFYTGGSERVRIDTSGRITTPYQPCFSVSGSGSQSWSGAANTQIVQLGVVSINRGSHYNASTYTFTAPVAGAYLFIADITQSTAVTGPQAIIYKNGSAFRNMPIAYSTAYMTASSSIIMDLAANDAITLRVINYNDVSLTLDTGRTFFTGVFLG